MRRVAQLAAVAGLALAVILFAREDVGRIAALVVAAGAGLLLAGLFHVLPMIVFARGWQKLLSAPRPSLRVLSLATWLRESVNGLLPVARIGGEVVAYRIVRPRTVHGSDLAASLVVDMALSVLSQSGFALLGLSLLFAVGGASSAATQLLVGVGGMIPLGVGFVVAQRAGALSAFTRMLDRLFTGRLEIAHAHAGAFDEALRAIYARRWDVGSCFLWQLAGWLLGAGEVWLALYFLGEQRGVLDAVIIESLIQALSSAAFIVPGALGVQEGGFVVIGALLGIDAPTALALAAARRLRDAVVFFPGLLAWQWVEARMRDARSMGTSQTR